MRLGNISERLSKNVYFVSGESHIKLDQIALKGAAGDLLVKICPAGVYVREASGEMSAGYAACLECGTCLAMCDNGLKWHYPKGGDGVCFKEG